MPLSRLAFRVAPLLLLATNSMSADVNAPIVTIAGKGNCCGFSGDGGLAIVADLFNPTAIAVDNSGNVFIADANNSRVRKVSPDGIITTVAGGGPPQNIASDSVGDGGPATSATLYAPQSIAVDGSGNLYISEPSFPLNNNCRIRKVSPTGIITTVTSFGTRLYQPEGIAVDTAGNLFVAELSTVVKLSANGTATRVAGNGTPGVMGDGGPATSAQLGGAIGIAVDSAGNLYIADTGNGVIRKVSAQTGLISTIAGQYVADRFGTSLHPPGFSGDGGPATLALLNRPTGVSVDATGNLFIADQNNNRIRKVSLDGIISTVAGVGTNAGIGGFSGDGGPATSASLSTPFGVAADSTSGNLFIADFGNNRIRKVLYSVPSSPIGAITSVANGASFAQTFSPGALISVFGRGFSDGGEETIASTPLPLVSSTGTSVTINGIPAPLLYVSAAQINLQVPYEVPVGDAVLVVNLQTYSISNNLPIQAAGPGIFVDARNGHIVPWESAMAGTTIGLFATGVGLVSPSVVTGTVPASGGTPVPRLPVNITVGGLAVKPTYIGMPEWSVGTLQINFAVPSTLAAGVQPVVISIGGIPSKAALVTIER